MNNLILIGMPGAGKSTVGVLLAKKLSMAFIDTDIVIQQQCGAELQSIVEKQGYLALRKIEEEVIVALSVINTVIATGGSAVYSSNAMRHLDSIGQIVYLKLAMNRLLRRIDNYATRGIASPQGQSFRSLFVERTKLYRQYGEMVIDCGKKTQDEIAAEIAGKVQGA